MPRIVRGFARLLAVASLVLTCAFAAAAPAASDPVAGVTCPLGQYSIGFTPRVGTTPQDINAHVQYSFTSCLSLQQAGVKSGTVSYDIFRGAFTCSIIADTFAVDYRIQWNTGAVSNVRLNGVSLAETTLVTGTVQSGLFAGRTVTILVQGLSATVPLDCFTSGISSYTGIVALDIT